MKWFFILSYPTKRFQVCYSFMINSADIKYYLLIVISCILVSCISNPEQDTEEKVFVHEDTLPLSPPTDKQVATQLTTEQEVQNDYFAITTDYEEGKLDSTTFKYDCDGEKSGTVTYFSLNGDLKMIIHTHAEYDHNEMKDRYFVKNGILFFAHLWSLSWSFDSGPEGATRDKIIERRVYLSNWKSFKCLEKKYEIRLHAGVNPTPASIPNKEVDCASSKSVEKPFRLLAKYWKMPAPKCLVD